MGQNLPSGSRVASAAARPFIYRAVDQGSCLPHPLRRSTDAHEAAAAPDLPRPLFASFAAGAVVLQFRVAIRQD